MTFSSFRLAFRIGDGTDPLYDGSALVLKGDIKLINLFLFFTQIIIKEIRIVIKKDKR
jgi:hypothetical protein